MAINLHRAARRTHQASCTGENVGPGTYTNTHNEPAPPVPEAVVPFNSLQAKKLNHNTGTSAITPGPGAYIGTEVLTNSGDRGYGENGAGVGPCALKSKVKRLGPTAPGSSVYMPSTIEKNPGPGTYKDVVHQDLGKAMPKELQGPVRPVISVMEKTTPSIPLMKLLPGQRPDMEADADVANLCMRHTGDRGDIAGPGEYDPKGDAIVMRTAQHTVFHMSKLQRTLWEPSVGIDNKMPPKENPGPGSYDAAPVGEREKEDEIVPTYQFSSRSRMAHQIQVVAERAGPGPGQYDIVGDIEKGAKTARAHSTTRGDLTQFGSMTERATTLMRPVDQPFKDPYHLKNVPGPGHYAELPGAFLPDPRSKDAEKALPDAKKKRFHGVHHPGIVMALAEAPGPLQAFLSTDDRPCNKPADQRTPAPWQYNKETARGLSMSADLRERAKVGRRGAFGCCADRFYGSPLAAKLGVPDPGLDGTEGIQTRANAEPRSMFQSAAPRFHPTAGAREVNATKVGNHDTPAPGQYMVEKEPTYRSPFRHPRQDHLSFGSCKQRFESRQAEDLFYEHAPPVMNPGPGDYNEGAARNRHVGGAAALKANRPPNFVGSTNEAVGPGSYGNVETHMLKKTFNVSTQAPVSADGPEASSRRSGRGRGLVQ